MANLTRGLQGLLGGAADFLLMDAQSKRNLAIENLRQRNQNLRQVAGDAAAMDRVNAQLRGQMEAAGIKSKGELMKVGLQQDAKTRATREKQEFDLLMQDLRIGSRERIAEADRVAAARNARLGRQSNERTARENRAARLERDRTAREQQVADIASQRVFDLTKQTQPEKRKRLETITRESAKLFGGFFSPLRGFSGLEGKETDAFNVARRAFELSEEHKGISLLDAVGISGLEHGLPDLTIPVSEPAHSLFRDTQAWQDRERLRQIDLQKQISEIEDQQGLINRWLNNVGLGPRPGGG